MQLSEDVAGCITASGKPDPICQIYNYYLGNLSLIPGMGRRGGTPRQPQASADCPNAVSLLILIYRLNLFDFA
jgi:hypothetical protein